MKFFLHFLALKHLNYSVAWCCRNIWRKKKADRHFYWKRKLNQKTKMHYGRNMSMWRNFLFAWLVKHFKWCLIAQTCKDIFQLFIKFCKIYKICYIYKNCISILKLIYFFIDMSWNRQFIKFMGVELKTIFRNWFKRA